MTSTHIVDPEGRPGGSSGDFERLIRCSYAKYCRYAGRPDIADRLMGIQAERHLGLGSGTELLADVVGQLAERMGAALPTADLHVVGLAPAGGIVVAQREVWAMLEASPQALHVPDITGVLRSWPEQRELLPSKAVWLPNGFAVLPFLEQRQGEAGDG